MFYPFFVFFFLYIFELRNTSVLQLPVSRYRTLPSVMTHLRTTKDADPELGRRVSAFVGANVEVHERHKRGDGQLGAARAVGQSSCEDQKSFVTQQQ